MPASDGTRPVGAHRPLGPRGPSPASRSGRGERGLTARRALLHRSAVARLARLESRSLPLTLRCGRWMDTGSLPSRWIQVTPGLRHLRIDGLEGLRTCGRRTVLVVIMDGLALTALAGQACCPEAIPRPAKQDERAAERWKSCGGMCAAISQGLEGGSPCSQKPDALHVARGVPLKPAAGSAAGAGAIDVELAHIPWLVGRSTSAGGLSPRAAKPHKIETRHLSSNDTDRMLCCALVIEQSGQKQPWGPAVPLKVSHPAALLCSGGSVYWRVRGHKEFSPSLALEPTVACGARSLSAWRSASGGLRVVDLSARFVNSDYLLGPEPMTERGITS
jgi:hypothetical protein